MEVHHHPHLDSGSHRKKGFKEYLLEFFMLFLAVFLGFVAENIRETSVEQKRGAEYVARLTDDLKNDTAWFDKENKRLALQNPNFDTLVNLLISPTPAHDARILSKLFSINYVSDARLNTATYNQMKSSGSLRYIRNTELATAIQEYYEIELPRAIESSASTRNFFNQYIKSFFIDHLRNQDMIVPTDIENWKPVILDRTRRTDQRLERTQLNIAAMFYTAADKKARKLIALIQKNYN